MLNCTSGPVATVTNLTLASLALTGASLLFARRALLVFRPPHSEWYPKGRCRFPWQHNLALDAGTIPACLAASFPGLKTLDLSGNAFTGSLPASLAGLVNLTSLSVYSNQLSGTVPAFASSTALSLAYNPLLGGPLPSAVNLSSAGSAAYVTGTALGLDRPLTAILTDIKSALDPVGTVLTSWNASGPLSKI